MLVGIFSGTVLPAQTLLFQWAFDDANGCPTTADFVRGGLLQIDAHVDGHAAFQSTGGVSQATPGVLNATLNGYGNNAGSAQISSGDSPLHMKDELSQFVVMLWIKPVLSRGKQPYARLLNISPADSEKGRPGLFVAFHNSDLEVGVNGSNTLVTLPPDTIKEGEWSFIVFVYDGKSTNPYYSVEMKDVVGSERNTAIFIGSTTSAVKLMGSAGLNTGAPGFKTSTGPLALDGLTVSVGSGNGNKGRAFCGFFDDIRIYSGLLKTGQIDAARLEATK